MSLTVNFREYNLIISMWRTGKLSMVYSLPSTVDHLCCPLKMIISPQQLSGTCHGQVQQCRTECCAHCWFTLVAPGGISTKNINKIEYLKSAVTCVWPSVKILHLPHTRRDLSPADWLLTKPIKPPSSGQCKSLGLRPGFINGKQLLRKKMIMQK